MIEKIWKFFSSLKPAGFIFTALTLSILIGSFIIQRPLAQEGQIERAYSEQTIQIFEFFGFFDLYHSPWFVFLIFLLGVNVICASIEMWPRHVKLSSKYDPLLSEAALRNQSNFKEISLGSGSKQSRIEAIKQHLSQSFKKPEIHEKDGKTHFFVNKQRFGYFGVYVVHSALIIIMIGGIWGSIGGFEGQMGLMEGEVSNKIYIPNAVKRNKILPFSIKANDIWIETYEDGSPKDYYSDLEVIGENGQSVKRKVIQVNEPLSYKGISFYQANYGKNKMNVEKFYKIGVVNRKTKQETIIKVPEERKSFDLPGENQSIEMTHYNPDPVMPTEKGPVALGETIRFSLQNGKNQEAVTIFKDFPQLDEVLRPNAKQSFVFHGLEENFDLKEVTGLQVAKDPGAPIVFWGCAILVIGIFWTFFTSHQKIWLVLSDDQILAAGKTYRNQVAFRTKFENVLSKIQNEM